MGRSRARMVKICFLLNSKAYCYLSRIGNDRQTKMALDANDILLIADLMQRQRVPARSSDCRWLTEYDFWTTFCSGYMGAERVFHALGLQRDKTPSASNRESRNSSMASLSRRSSGNRSGQSNRR